MNRIIYSTIAALFVFLCIGIFSCNKIKYYDGDIQLGVSTDTLRFDTVFTTIGSSTRIIKLYNPHKDWIKIDRIWLESGSASRFKINVDGVSTLDIKDLEIAPNDSLYIFASVTVDPDQPVSLSPFIFNELLNISVKNGQKRIVLEAWGQNANYVPDRYSKSKISYYGGNFQEFVWSDPKPYVIYGALYFDSCKVIMPAGCRVYVHGGLGRDENKNYYNDGLIIIGPKASLEIRGTHDKPVTIQGDRLEEDYRDLAGQWGGIILAATSRGNIVNYANIKNGVIGFRVDSLASLTLNNTRIQTMSSVGLYGDFATVKANNCLITDCNTHCVALTHGGTSQFNYCTLANYGVTSGAMGAANNILVATNYKCFDQECKDPDVKITNIDIKNSIIYSSAKDAIGFVDATEGVTPGYFNYTIANSAIKAEKIVDSKGFGNFFSKISQCILLKNTDKVFKEINRKNYHLDSLSVVEKKALPLPLIAIDIEDKIRDASTPDIGCYEY